MDNLTLVILIAYFPISPILAVPCALYAAITYFIAVQDAVFMRALPFTTQGRSWVLFASQGLLAQHVALALHALLFALNQYVAQTVLLLPLVAVAAWYRHLIKRRAYEGVHHLQDDTAHAVDAKRSVYHARDLAHRVARDGLFAAPCAPKPEDPDALTGPPLAPKPEDPEDIHVRQVKLQRWTARYMRKDATVLASSDSTKRLYGTMA